MGAHTRDEGAVMIAGTGSCGYSFVNGKATILGAHGFPFGDKCSGAWIGLEAVKAVASIRCAWPANPFERFDWRSFTSKRRDDCR